MSKKVKSFQRSNLATGLLLAFGGSLVVIGSPAFAQATGEAAADAPARIEVTGSRLRSLDAESPSPLQVITGEEIAKSGVANIQDLLLKNPTMGAPTLSRTNSNFLTSSAGVATIDLRNLGPDRTLVLVNGRRFVAGVPTSSQVDLNTIPTDLIDRVEILTGGASATYGSDAVAGVVNIILKKGFEGISFNVQRGMSEKGDDNKEMLGITMGTNSADGKGSLLTYIGFSRQGAVMARDRGMGTDNISDANFTGDPADTFKFTTPFYSAVGANGHFYTDDPVTGGQYTIDGSGNVVPWSTNGPAGDGVGAFGYNRQNDRYIAVPTTRYLLTTIGEYAIADDHKLWVEGMYAQTKTKSQLEPFPFASDSLFPSTGGQVPAEFLVNGRMVANPLIPASLLATMADTDGDGARDFFFQRRLTDVGNRGNTADRDTFRLATGFKGTIFKDWDYDTYVSYGSTKESQISGGQFNAPNFAQAMQAVPDFDDLDGDGDTSEAVCYNADARASGCVPTNVFGYNTISPAALTYIQAPALLSTFTSQKLAGGVIRGEPFEMPAGKVGLAAGFEWREEYSRSEYDALQQSGQNGGNALPRTEGEFNVREAFLETRIPLLKGMPGAESLAINAAVRGSDYSTVGKTTSWTAGLEWSPIKDIRIRATKAIATRAPNIGELYSPLQQTFEGVTDPCLNVTATSTGKYDDRCRADPGVAANIAQNGKFELNQSDTQGISGFNGGNPDLNEEKGDSWTLGVVFTPTSIAELRNFTFSADYFRVKVKDAIVGTPRQASMEQCYSADGDASFCDFIVRRPAAIGANSAGSIEFVNSFQTNSGGLFTSGVDLVGSYSGNVGPGRLNARLAYTYLDDGYVIPSVGSEKDKFVGEIGAARNRANLALGYTYGPFGVATSTTFIGKSWIDDQVFGPKAVSVPAKTYFDMQASYTYEKATFYLGVDNMFDTKGPRSDSNATIFGTTGAGTDASVYDALGRRYYVGVRFDL